MSEKHITRSVRLSTSLHFASLADFRAAGNGQTIIPGQTVKHGDNGYGLQGNPTIHELQDSISKLEHGAHTLLFSSGMSALTALGALLKTGDHWILPDNVYSPMRRYADYLLQQYGITCDYYDPAAVETIELLIKNETKLIHIETPGSVTFDVTDINAVVRIAKSRGILTSADNTWAAGVLSHPLDSGVDISILSLTKYPAGYSDVFMGSLTVKDEDLFKRFSYYHRVHGYSVSPLAAMLVNRGLESIRVRLAAHVANADELVTAIQDHARVSKIYRVNARMDGAISGLNSLFSIELDREYSDEELEGAFATFTTFSIGESWGGTRSMVLPFQPADLSNRHSSPKRTVVRFHAGLDDIELQRTDIVNFLDALSHIKEKE
jgi:cysteine-S-conjugate beta-lyase